MAGFIKKQPPARIIAVGFLAVILIGSLLLSLPISLKDGVKLGYVDALYTSVSAVCVTGLNTIDPGSTFSVFGKIILALLIQIGGLGVASVGAGVIIAIGKRVDMKSRNVLKEALNLDSRGGVVKFLGNVFLTTVVIELAGAIAGFFVFADNLRINVDGVVCATANVQIFLNSRVRTEDFPRLRVHHHGFGDNSGLVLNGNRPIFQIVNRINAGTIPSRRSAQGFR